GRGGVEGRVADRVGVGIRAVEVGGGRVGDGPVAVVDGRAVGRLRDADDGEGVLGVRVAVVADDGGRERRVFQGRGRIGDRNRVEVGVEGEASGVIERHETAAGEEQDGARGEGDGALAGAVETADAYGTCGREGDD